MANTQTQVKSSTKSKLNGHPPHADIEVHGAPSLFDQAIAKYQAAQDEVLAMLGAPGWKRTLVALMTGIIVSCGIGYVAGQLLTWLLIGAAAAGVAMFVQILIGIAGLILAMIMGAKVSARLAGAILTGEADERGVAAYNATKALFKKLNPFKGDSKAAKPKARGTKLAAA